MRGRVGRDGRALWHNFNEQIEHQYVVPAASLFKITSKLAPQPCLSPRDTFRFRAVRMLSLTLRGRGMTL